jgi:ubiquinone/menaquinone biosynthesis C-methylase UbiE
VALQPGKTLEVGIGNGVVSHVLHQAGVNVTRMDFDESLEPDVVAEVTEMPFADGAFDIVACFEVLEHLPFDLVPQALRELCRVSRAHVLFSVPDWDHDLRMEVCLPGLGRRRLRFSLPRLVRCTLACRRHYWEIGANGCSLERLIQEIEAAGLRIVETYRAWELSYVRFFRLRKPARESGHEH